MSQNDIEVSLAQQLAEYLAMPIFIVDPSGDMLFFNESAEVILGCQYHEIETVPASEWPTVFAPLNFESRLLEPKELPLIIAMTKHHPDQKRLRIRGLDQTLREIDVIAFPILAQEQRYLGAAAVFWEVAKSINLME